MFSSSFPIFSPKMVDTVPGDSTGWVNVSVGMRSSLAIISPRTPDDSTGLQTSLVWKRSLSQGFWRGGAKFPQIPLNLRRFP